MAKLPSGYREKIEELVFEQIPELDNVFTALDIKKIRGYNDYYRIRAGGYIEVGCKVETEVFNHET